jgi:hypothetical protein
MLDQHSALERYDQAKRDYYKGINKEDIMPFLPTTKQILENQAVRDVKGEMLMMRGHILTNFQKMRQDMDNIKGDVAKSNTRFKYAQAEFQDSLKREMAMRDNQMIDVLDHIRQWNPNQVVHPQDQQVSQKHLSKVPDFYIPQLNFESVTNELRQRLEELKNPHVFRNAAARKLEEYNTKDKVMVNPHQYVKPEDLRNGNFFVNPQSRYLDEVLEEERQKADMERAQRLKHLQQGKHDTGKYSNHPDTHKKPTDIQASASHIDDHSKADKKPQPTDLSDNYSNEFILDSVGKDSTQNPKKDSTLQPAHNNKDAVILATTSSKPIQKDQKPADHNHSNTNNSFADSYAKPAPHDAHKQPPQEDSKEIIEDEDGGLIEDLGEEEQYEYDGEEEQEFSEEANPKQSSLPPIQKPKP